MHRPRVRPIVAAHRGGAILWPENSPTAFRGALGLPVDQIETDVRLSSDGEPFILHDATLDRTTEARGRATGLDWATLSRIRLAGADGETIPHLDDVLRLLARSPVDLRLELKVDADGLPQGALAARVRRSLEDHGMMARTTLTSFDLAYLREVAAYPVAGRIWLVHRTVLEREGFDAVIMTASREALPEIAIHVSQIDLAPPNANPGAGVRVGVYAVNDQETIDSALRYGASAFTTDRPDIAVSSRERAFDVKAAE